MKAVVKGVDALATLIERVLAIALLFAISLNFVNVVGRYVFSYALNGADEIEIYILIWIAFLGAATVTWRGLHLRMDVLVNALPAPLRFAVWVVENSRISNSCGLCRLAVLQVCRAHLCARRGQRHRTCPDLDSA